MKCATCLAFCEHGRAGARPGAPDAPREGWVAQLLCHGTAGGGTRTRRAEHLRRVQRVQGGAGVSRRDPVRMRGVGSGAGTAVPHTLKRCRRRVAGIAVRLTSVRISTVRRMPVPYRRLGARDKADAVAPLVPTLRGQDLRAQPCSEQTTRITNKTGIRYRPLAARYYTRLAPHADEKDKESGSLRKGG